MYFLSAGKKRYKDLLKIEAYQLLLRITVFESQFLIYHNIKSPEVEETTEKGKRPIEKKHNLQISMTSFIGREKEIKEVKVEK